MLYSQVSSVVLALGNTRRPGDVDDNMAQMRAMSDPQAMTALLGEVLGDAELLSVIANRSYRHVNHFDKIVLVEAGIDNGYRLTLHLWNPPYAAWEKDDELIHDHRFSFWSAILAGTLRSQEFIPDDAGVAYQNYRYSPDQRSETNNYSFQGVRRLKREERVLEKAQEVYHLAYDTTHRVILPDSGLTCTLVLRSPRARGYSNVYNTSYPATDTSNANRMFTPSELRDRLERIRAAIGRELPAEEPVRRVAGA